MGSVSRLLSMRRLGISLDSFERGRHLLCRTAWKQDRQCDPNTLAGIFELATRDQQREAEKEEQEVTTMVYLAVLAVFYVGLAVVLIASTVSRSRKGVIRIVRGEEDLQL